MLTGCGTNGDFGRVRPSLVNDDTHAWMGPAAARGPATNLAWRHQLTDEERMLRDLAYPLIEPPYDRNKWYSVIGEIGAGSRPWPYPDRSAYASRLFTTAYRSQTARYNRLIEDIRNDVMRLDPFFGSARYVARHGSQAREGAGLCHEPDGGGARQHAAAHRGEPQHRAVGAGVASASAPNPTGSRSSAW